MHLRALNDHEGASRRGERRLRGGLSMWRLDGDARGALLRGRSEWRATFSSAISTATLAPAVTSAAVATAPVTASIAAATLAPTFPASLAAATLSTSAIAAAVATAIAAANPIPAGFSFPVLSARMGFWRDIWRLWQLERGHGWLHA
jgi:hypothetical protein